MLFLVKPIMSKESTLMIFKVRIISLPGEDVPQRSDKVTDREDQYDQLENSEGIVKHDLTHYVIIVF